MTLNELDVLSRINHINVVKLRGCCLETEIPMLVYEYIEKTLSHLLHGDKAEGARLSWDDRLRIATEAADALSYLHSSAYPPILHRDVKSENILLDSRFTAKVADFGGSRLIPLGMTEADTLLVQGTWGYLDPEFLQSGKLTEKSDVYSFGVVLAEMVTGKRAVFIDGSAQRRGLASYFLSRMDGVGLWDEEIFDGGAVGDQYDRERMRQMADLAKSCMSARRDDRPSMKSVFHELEKIMMKMETKNLAAPREMNAGGDDTSVGDQQNRPIILV